MQQCNKFKKVASIRINNSLRNTNVHVMVLRAIFVHHYNNGKIINKEKLAAVT